MQQHDAIRPAHYVKGGMMCIDVIRVMVEDHDGFEGHCLGTVIKYLWRWKQKNGVEDLKKARAFLDYMIEYVEGKENGG